MRKKLSLHPLQGLANEPKLELVRNYCKQSLFYHSIKYESLPTERELYFYIIKLCILSIHSN